MKNEQQSEILIGAHTSAQGGPQNALQEGKNIGASTIQLFTANQRQWNRKPISKQTLDLFQTTLQEIGLKKIMSHASYLINLGSPNEETLEKSRNCLLKEISDCLSLGISFVNIHPGAALNSPREECLNRIIQSLLKTQKLFSENNQHPLTILLETTAGQGSLIGYCFEELAYILSHTISKIPIGICIDTCHIFAAGYDIRTPEGWEQTLENFDKTIGLQYLKALHLNDSVHDFKSKKDNHACLGEGKIGWAAFEYTMKNEKLKDLPKYLETPGGPEIWAQEIRKLRKCYVL